MMIVALHRKTKAVVSHSSCVLLCLRAVLHVILIMIMIRYDCDDWMTVITVVIIYHCCYY